MGNVSWRPKGCRWRDWRLANQFPRSTATPNYTSTMPDPEDLQREIFGGSDDDDLSSEDGKTRDPSGLIHTV